MSTTNTGNLVNSTILAYNNIGTSPVTVIGINSGRKKLTFHNPGLIAGSVDVVVFPLTVLQNTPGGASVALTPTTAALGGGFRIFAAGGDRVIEGQAAKQGWQALSLSGSGNSLTVMEES